MDSLLALNHLLNFAAPALTVAVLLVACSHLFMRKLAQAQGWIGPVAINFIVGCGVLSAGLLLLGRDGKMVTYAVLVLACASCQWLLLRAWRG